MYEKFSVILIIPYHAREQILTKILYLYKYKNTYMQGRFQVEYVYIEYFCIVVTVRERENKMKIKKTLNEKLSSYFLFMKNTFAVVQCT